MYTLLRKVREARGLSQSALARAVSISPSYLCKIEGGHVTMPAKLKSAAEKIAKFFDGEITETQILFPERYANGHGGKRTTDVEPSADDRRVSDKSAEKESA